LNRPPDHIRRPGRTEFGYTAVFVALPVGDIFAPQDNIRPGQTFRTIVRRLNRYYAQPADAGRNRSHH